VGCPKWFWCSAVRPGRGCLPRLRDAERVSKMCKETVQNVLLQSGWILLKTGLFFNDTIDFLVAGIIFYFVKLPIYKNNVLE
jgi:hypothetical protein